MNKDNSDALPAVATSNFIPNGDDQVPALSALTNCVADFGRLKVVPNCPSNNELYHRILEVVHRICSALLLCERAGLSRSDIISIMQPVREIHARSPFVRRLQEWPRGYPGDFETVQYICKGENRAPRDDLAHYCEAYALNSPIAQQHRNKVHMQAARILRTATANPRARILSIACGSCPDFAEVGPLLRHFEGEVWLNDSDSDALRYSTDLVSTHVRRCFTVPGNAITLARRSRDLGEFDLVIAGGLFDYLPDRAAILLIQNVWRRLLSEQGVFFFTNIASHNPYRCLIEYFGDWFLKKL